MDRSIQYHHTGHKGRSTAVAKSQLKRLYARGNIWSRAKLTPEPPEAGLLVVVVVLVVVWPDGGGGGGGGGGEELVLPRVTEDVP